MGLLLPSQGRLCEIFSYDPISGQLVWRVRGRLRGTSLLNTEVGTAALSGRQVKIGGVSYKIHRIIWKMVTGIDPEVVIDHINGDPFDNSWSNLRLATVSENARNAKKRRDGASLYKGISFHSKDKKWRAQITLHRQWYNLGSYDTPEQAHQAYCDGARRLHGNFAREA